MNAKPVDIFLHFLNKDTQDIFGRISTNVSLLKLGLNASVLMCDQYCIIPPGFYFESSATRQLIDANVDLLTEGLLCFSMKEEFDEYVEKKRELLHRYKGNPAYDCFFDDRVPQKIMAVNPVIIDRSASVGERCINEWTTQHRFFLEGGNGSFARIYKMIPDWHDAKKIANILDTVAQQAHGNAFVWSIITQSFADNQISDKQFQKEIRNAFEKTYYTVYLNEYHANILYDFYPIDKKIDFYLCKEYTANANYRWFEHFLNVLQLGYLLTLPSETIVFLKKSSLSYSILLDIYYSILNGMETETSGRVISSMDRSVKKMIQSNENDIQSLVRTVREETTRCPRQIYLTGRPEMVMAEKNDTSICDKKVDVLIISSTIEEEESILNNDNKWEPNLTSTGTEYYVQKDGDVMFAMARGSQMRETAAAIIGQELIVLLRPKYIAMVGFCAGKKGKVNLGDVVVADKVYVYDIGKIKEDGNRLPEISAYALSGKWKQIVERFDNSWREKITVTRPVDYEYERFCFIRECANAKAPIDPMKQWRNDEFPDLRELIQEYSNENCIKLRSGKITITKMGKDRFCNEMTTTYWKSYTTPEPALKVGSMATGADVQEQADIFDYLEKTYDRKTIALDMEAHAIGGLSNYNEANFIVAKGVGDFANSRKSFANRFLEYAVFSSYTFVKEFFKTIYKRDELLRFHNLEQMS